jgi:3-hydroxyacyl-CoA dehydrogenase/enoyl-CoA hydratase/3-hydroxybutyryl-CoA epimerase
MTIESNSSVFDLVLNDDNIAIVTIDVPGEKMNTLRDSFAGDLDLIMQLGVEKKCKGYGVYQW